MSFMRMDPILAALDADHDGLISAEEIAGAAIALRKLDKNQDGKLTEDEVRDGASGVDAGRNKEGAPLKIIRHEAIVDFHPWLWPRTGPWKTPLKNSPHPSRARQQAVVTREKRHRSLTVAARIWVLGALRGRGAIRPSNSNTCTCCRVPKRGRRWRRFRARCFRRATASHA